MKNNSIEQNMKYNLKLLEDKVCVIVGASSLRSIGYATAEMFAANGAKLVLVDLKMDEQIAQEIKDKIHSETGVNNEIQTLCCNISIATECDAAIESVMEKFGTIDCLVNCAGIVKTGGIFSITEDEYDTILDVNLKGTFNICRSVLSIFSKNKSGVIVNLSSLAAQRGGGLVGGVHYAASKGGVLSLTKAIAREFAPLGIRANAICPAMIETDMLNNLTKDQLNEVVTSIPLKRLGTTKELAGACLFLASSLSGFITGATIDVNGGIHIH